MYEKACNRMKMKLFSDKKNKIFYIYFLLIIILAIPLALLGIFLYGQGIINFVYSTNNNYLTDLTRHQAKLFEKEVEDKYKELKNIIRRAEYNFEHGYYKDPKDFEKEINNEAQLLGYKRIFLINNNDEIIDFNSSPALIINTVKLNFYSKDRFIVRLPENDFIQDNIGLIGTRFKNTTINNESYSGISAIIDLKLIIDKIFESNYEVSLNNYICYESGNILLSNSNKKINNFFIVLSKSTFKNTDLDTILKKIKNKENFFFTFNYKNKDIYARIENMKFENYFYVTTIPQSQFSQSSKRFIIPAILFTVVTTILLIVFLFVTLFVYKKNYLMKSESIEKTAFLSTMSHEIRTPLNGIIGLVHLMNNNRNNPERLNYYFAKIGKTSNYLLQLINNILDISKFENGKIQLANSPFFIDEMIESIVSINRDNMATKGIKFEVNQNIFCRAIYGDQIRIQQIIMNLIGNAYKFTEKDGKITFTIYQENTFDSERISTIFVVEDTGCGISKEFQKHIFEAFSQERNKVKISQKGTGLGLAISYMLAKQMGGNLELKSELGQGSKFTFILPSNIASPKQVSEYMRENKAINSEKEHNILIAEDNELSAEILDEILNDEKIKHKIVYDGKQVIEEFSESSINEYDLILMDIQMPFYDGYEATQIIRNLKRPDAKSVIIIACSANTFEEDKEAAKDAGMNGFIVKPINIEKLIDILTYD